LGDFLADNSFWSVSFVSSNSYEGWRVAFRVAATKSLALFPSFRGLIEQQQEENLDAAPPETCGKSATAGQPVLAYQALIAGFSERCLLGLQSMCTDAAADYGRTQVGGVFNLSFTKYIYLSLFFGFDARGVLCFRFGNQNCFTLGGFGVLI
jgi:hypothetical protein